MTKIKSLNEKINGGNNPFFQELYGADSSVLKEQAHRYASLMSDFEKTYGTDDVQLFTSPGRTEIGGNHTDHNYGRVLAGAVNLDNIAVAAQNGVAFWPALSISIILLLQPKTAQIQSESNRLDILNFRLNLPIFSQRKPNFILLPHL